MSSSNHTITKGRSRARFPVPLRLMSVGFDRVELELDSPDGRRLVVARVGSGRSWREAVRFPCLGTDGSETTGDEALDAEIRERAAEELVRLDAATIALGTRAA